MLVWDACIHVVTCLGWACLPVVTYHRRPRLLGLITRPVHAVPIPDILAANRSLIGPVPVWYATQRSLIGHPAGHYLSARYHQPVIHQPHIPDIPDIPDLIASWSSIGSRRLITYRIFLISSPIGASIRICRAIKCTPSLGLKSTKNAAVPRSPRVFHAKGYPARFLR